MKKLIVAAIMLMAAPSAYGFECHECHSKNPAMVKMHKALEGKWCFDCHKMGEKLMGRGVPKDKASQLKRRATDPLCVGCHNKQP